MFIPRKIGVNIYVIVEIIIAALPPPSRIVNKPIINTVAEVMIAGTIRMTNIASPNSV